MEEKSDPVIIPKNDPSTPEQSEDLDLPTAEILEGAPRIAWLGSFSLLAVGIAATVITGGAFLAIALLAIGVVALAATIAVELFDSLYDSAISAAARAAWGIWAGLKEALSGNFIEAGKSLQLVKFRDWFWMIVFAAIGFIAIRHFFKKKKAD